MAAPLPLLQRKAEREWTFHAAVTNVLPYLLCEGGEAELRCHGDETLLDWSFFEDDCLYLKYAFIICC